MIRPSKILSGLALELLEQFETLGAAMAVLVVATLVSKKVEDRVERHLEQRAQAAADEVAKPDAGRRGAYGTPIMDGACGEYWADEGGEWMCRRPLDHDGDHDIRDDEPRQPIE